MIQISILHATYPQHSGTGLTSLSPMVARETEHLFTPWSSLYTQLVAIGK